MADPFGDLFTRMPSNTNNISLQSLHPQPPARAAAAPLHASYNIVNEERYFGARDESDEDDDEEMEDDSPHPHLPPRLPPRRGPSSPEEKDILRSLSETLDVESREATFTCGGKIPMVLTSTRDEAGNLTPRTHAKVHEQRITTKPITIRWGADGMGRLVSFPGHSEGTLQHLVSDCQPATFGRKGKDVYDESYRRAGAMSTENFMSDFCPYEAGIMDVVTQMLVPDISCDLDRPAPPTEVIMTAAEREQICEAFWRFAPRDEFAIPLTRVVEALESLGLPIPDGYMRPWTWTEFHCHAEQFILRRKMEAARRLRAAWEEKAFFRGLRAELYKLNVYSGPSGMFKKHVDTPRSQEQIGSLVVCLPVAFEGGELAVRHQGHQILYDWTTPSPSDEPAIHWAAFYSDIEHEVLPVTSGHRITLTYNLFLSPGTGLLTSPKPLSLQPENLPFHNHLTQSLSSQHFMPQGGHLGFHLAHSYPHTHPHKHKFVPKMLKGIDMAVYISLAAANLPTMLTPYPFTDQSYRLQKGNLLEALETDFNPGYEEDDADSDEVEDDLEEDEHGKLLEGGMTPNPYTEAWDVKVRKRFQGSVVWLNEGCGAAGREMRKACLAYGNQAELKVKYSSAAIVVRIPGWEERNGKGRTVERAIQID
ncbi:hypothetical protein B0A50_05709 [Lecanosticta acicola]|uniref:Fe2OG dioxygenase domain-containing protein n=1 Tax=Lecanosticta acicola TaxID=111012 RepID=A0AAI9EAQ1_9PEZI|nr:hypothetical protein B0A50_05709 [Lecanosticta acicola]